MANVADFLVVQPEWKHHRVIHSKYPVSNLFSEDDRTNFNLTAFGDLTSGRVSVGDVVQPFDIRTGNGWGGVMASFSYPRAGRFSTDTRGAYYCADDVVTSIKEWTHHTERYWLNYGFTDDCSAVVRCYTGHFDKPLVDVRGYEPFSRHDPEYDYRDTQLFATQVIAAGGWGILSDSVRNPSGTCASLLRPPATTQVKQAGHYVCIFDGHAFVEYAQIKQPIKLL